MITLQQTDNPIFWQELNYQVRSVNRYVRHLWFVWPLLLGAMLGAVLFTLQRVDNPTRELSLYTIWIVHAVVAVRAIIAGANAISREHVGLTWDALILTGVSARQILLGKWRAVLRRVAPWMLALGTVRLVMLPVFMLALTNRYAWRVASYGLTYSLYSSNSGTGYDPNTISWVPWAAVVAAMACVVLTILEVMCCSALGLAFSALTRRGVLAGVLALSIRFAPVAIFAVFTRYELGPAPAYRILRFTPFAIADSGTSPISMMAVPLIPWTTTVHTDALSGLLLATVVMLLFLAISLGIAWRAIRVGGALPHPRVEVVGKSFHPAVEG